MVSWSSCFTGGGVASRQAISEIDYGACPPDRRLELSLLHVAVGGGATGHLRQRTGTHAGTEVYPSGLQCSAPVMPVYDLVEARVLRVWVHYDRGTTCNTNVLVCLAKPREQLQNGSNGPRCGLCRYFPSNPSGAIKKEKRKC